MADQATGVGGAAIGDRNRAVGGDDFEIKVHQALAGNAARLCAHAVTRVAHRAREAVLNMASVFAEAGVIQNLVEVVALGAQSIGAAVRAALSAQAGVREEVGNGRAGSSCLTELIPAFKDMRKN